MIYQNNILDLATDYNYFILDVWGVIHDGSKIYPMVLEHLQQLRKLNKKICFLSNAPRRSIKVAEILKKYGIEDKFYDFIITSGEAVYSFLEENQNNNFKKLGRSYYYIGPDKDIDLLNGLGYQITEDASLANFVINTGFDNDFSTLEEKLPNLKQAIKFNLPMICANPDLIVIKQNGLEIICAGLMAREYEKMGGHVIYFGKPYSAVYERVFNLLGLQSKSKGEVLAVGDGIETDILGASQAKIDSALIAGGILSNQLGVKYGQLPAREKMLKICQQHNLYPNFIIAGL